MIFMIRFFINKLQQSIKDGIVFIFGSSVIAQLCTFISSILVIRFLPKFLYGEYVKASNYYGYIAVFIGAGLTVSVLQFCSENISDSERYSIYLHAIRRGSKANLLLVVLVLIIALLEGYYGNHNSSKYLISMSLLPSIQYIMNYGQIVLRVKRRNKEFAISNIIYSVSSTLGNVGFTYLFGVIGLVMALYISCLLSGIYCIIIVKNDNFFYNIKKSEKLNAIRTKEINKYAIICAVTNFSYSILLFLDITLLGLIIKDSTILADYKVAAAIPNALLFVSSSLVTFYYPQIVEVLSFEPESIERFLKKLMVVFVVINGIIFVFSEVFASYIIGFVYGSNYYSVVPIFRLLCVNFFFSSTIRKLLGNFISIAKHVEINFGFNIFSGCVNIILDIVLIPRLYSIGAAIATTICTLIMALLELLFVKGYLKKLR